MFLGTQYLPRNRGAYVDTQNWQIPRFARQFGRISQTGLSKFVKMPIVLHHYIDLVEMIEIHMWNVQFGVRMRKLCLPEDLHPGLTSQTGPGRSNRFGDRSDRSETPNPS